MAAPTPQIRAVFQFQFTDKLGRTVVFCCTYCKRFHSHGTSPGEPYPHRSLCTKHCMWHWAPVRHFFHPSLLVPSISSRWTPHWESLQWKSQKPREATNDPVRPTSLIYLYSLIMTYITSFGWFISPCLLIKKPPLFSLQKSRHVCCVLLCGMFFFRSPGFLPGLCQQGFLALQATGFVSENHWENHGKPGNPRAKNSPKTALKGIMSHLHTPLCSICSCCSSVQPTSFQCSGFCWYGPIIENIGSFAASVI